MPLTIQERGTFSNEDDLPGGVHVVSWGGFTTLEDGVPVTKANPNRPDIPPAAYARFDATEGQFVGKSAPVSLRGVEQLNYWHRAFCGKDWTGGFDLTAFDNAMGRAPKTVQIKVKDDGWTAGVYVPEGTYPMRFGRYMTSEQFGPDIPGWFWDDPPPNSKSSAKYKKCRGELEIVFGKYKGCLVPFSHPYTIDYHPPKPEEGFDGGHALKDGSIFYEWGAPWGADWEALGAVVFADPENILPEWQAHLKAAGKTFQGRVDKRGWVSGRGAVTPLNDDMLDLVKQAEAKTAAEAPPAEPAPAAQATPLVIDRTAGPAAPVPVAEPATNGAAPQPKAAADPPMASVRAAMDEVATALGLTTPTWNTTVTPYVMTESGLTIARDHVKKFCVDEQFPTNFGKMTAQQQTRIAQLLREVTLPVVTADAVPEGASEDF